MHQVVARREVGHVNLGELRRVGVLAEEQLAGHAEDRHVPHALAANIQHHTRRVRVEGDFRRDGVVVNTVVESDIQGQVHDAVAVRQRVVLDVIVEGAAVGRGDDEVAAVAVFVLAHGRVTDVDVVGRVQCEVQHIDAVAAPLGGQRIVVIASHAILAAAPLVRYVVAGRRLGLHQVGRHHLQDEGHGAVTARRVAERLLRVDCAGLRCQRVEAVLRVVAALTDGVANGHRIALVNGELQLIDVVTAETVREGVVVGARRREHNAAPGVRQLRVADGVGLGHVARRVHREGEGDGAVTAVDGRQRVVIDTALRQGLSVPEIRQVVVAGNSCLGEVVRRVYVQREMIDAVAVVDALVVILALTRTGERHAVPVVRQLVAADGHGVLEVIGRVDGDSHLVDLVTAGNRIVRGVTVGARLAEGHSAPDLALARTQHDGVVVDDHRRVHGQGELIDAVAAVLGGQRVVIDAALRELAGAPEVGQLVLAGLIARREQELRSLVQREGHHAVAETVALEGDVVNTLLREGLSAVRHREVTGADPLLLRTRGRRNHRKVDGDEAVAGGGGAEVDVKVAGLGQRGRAVKVGQRLLAHSHGVVVVVNRVDIQREVRDGETVAGISLHEVVLSGLGEGAVHERMRQLGSADGVGHGVLGVRSDGELQVPHTVATVDGLQGDGVAARRAVAVVGIEVVRQRAVADGDRSVGTVGRVHDEVQGQHAVAAARGGVCGRVVAARLIFVVLPEVRQIDIADLHRGVRTVGRVDGQRDGGGAVAAVHGEALMHERVGARLREESVEAVLRVGGAGADGPAVGEVVARMDGQMQGVGAGTSVTVEVGIRVNACGMVGLAVPGETVANGRLGDVVCAVVHREVEGDDGVAAGGVREGVGEIIAGGREIRMLVPVEGLADNRRSVTRIAVVHRQVQRYHGVATGNVREGVGERLSGFGDVRMLIPVEAVTGNRRSVARVAVTDGEMQRHHTVAAARVREGVGERLGGFGDVRMLVPVEAVACKSGGITSIAVTDGQVQRHHRVATADVREGVGERLSGFGDVRMLVPVEAVAGKGGGVASVAVSDGQMQRHHRIAA